MPLFTGDDPPPIPARAPDPGQHTDDVLASVLGYDADRIAALRDSGAVG
jgi:formyl-CoA transferase